MSESNGELRSARIALLNAAAKFLGALALVAMAFSSWIDARTKAMEGVTRAKKATDLVVQEESKSKKDRAEVAAAFDALHEEFDTLRVAYEDLRGEVGRLQRRHAARPAQRPPALPARAVLKIEPQRQDQDDDQNQELGEEAQERLDQIEKHVQEQIQQQSPLPFGF